MLSAVAWYSSSPEIEHDVKTLARGGFDMTRVCVIGKDRVAPNQIAFVHTGRRARFFGAHGALWNTLSAILLGTALLCGPAGEHVVILGSLAGAIVPALGSANPLPAALAAHSFLLVIQADAQHLQRARELLPHADLKTFDSP